MGAWAVAWLCVLALSGALAGPMLSADGAGSRVRVCGMSGPDCDRAVLCDVVEKEECAGVRRADKDGAWLVRVTCSPTTDAWVVSYFPQSDAQCGGTASETVEGSGRECKAGVMVSCDWNADTEVNAPTEEPSIRTLKEDVFPGAYASSALAAGENMYNEVFVGAGVYTDDGKTHILATSGVEVWSLGVAGSAPGAMVRPLVRPGQAFFAAGGDALVFADADADAADDGPTHTVHLSGAAAGGLVGVVPHGGVDDGALAWVRVDAGDEAVSLVLVPAARDETAVRVLCAKCAATGADVVRSVYLEDDEEVVWVHSSSASELVLERFDVSGGKQLTALPLEQPACCRPVTSAHVAAAALLDEKAYVAVEFLMSGTWNVMVFAYEDGEVRATFDKLVGGRVVGADKVWPSALLLRDGDVSLVMVASDATTPTVMPVWADAQHGASTKKFTFDALFGTVEEAHVLSAPTWTGDLLFNVRDSEGHWRIGQLLPADDDDDDDDDAAGTVVSLVTSLDVPPYCYVPNTAVTFRGNEVYFACQDVPGVFFWSSDETTPPTTFLRTNVLAVGNATAVDALNWVDRYLLVSAHDGLFSALLNTETPPAPNGSQLPGTKSHAAMAAGVAIACLVVVGFLIYAMVRRRRATPQLNREALLS